MNSSSVAAWSARGVSIAGLIAVVAGALGLHLTAEQTEAISAVTGFIIVVGWPAYENAHAKSVDHKQQLADTLTANGIPIPPPASKDVEPKTTGTPITTTIGEK